MGKKVKKILSRDDVSVDGFNCFLMHIMMKEIFFTKHLLPLDIIFLVKFN